MNWWKRLFAVVLEWWKEQEMDDVQENTEPAHPPGLPEDPVEDPVVVVDPVPDAVVVEESYPEIFPWHTPMLWFGPSSPKEYGRIAKFDLEKPAFFSQRWLKGNRLCDAVKMNARHGGKNIATLNPLNTHSHSMNAGQVADLCDKALQHTEIHALALDMEGWALNDIKILTWMHAEALRAGKPFIVLPKHNLYDAKRDQVYPMKGAGLSYDNDHVPDSDPRAYEMQKERALYISHHCDWILPWSYGHDGEGYLDILAWWRGMGVKCCMTHGMGDLGYRPRYGGVTPQMAMETMTLLHSKQVGFAAFYPQKDIREREFEDPDVGRMLYRENFKYYRRHYKGV